jgi:hypothetical protein
MAGQRAQAAGRGRFRAYGWPADLSVEAMPEQLLALNLERATGYDQGP